VNIFLAAVPLLAASIPSSPAPAWTAPIGLHYRHRAIVDRNRLYFIAHNDFRDHVYALDATTGSALWHSASRVTRIDLYADGGLRAFTMDRYYRSIHTDTGKEFDTNDILNQPHIYEAKYFPLYLDGLTIVMSGSGELVALTSSGEKWRANPGWGSTVDATPLIQYKGLVLTGAQNGVKAYRIQSGALEWSSPEVKKAVAVKIYGDVTIVYDGYWPDPNTFVPSVRALDASTGRQLWSLETGEASSSRGWAVNDSQSDGNLLALPCADTADGPFNVRIVNLRTGAPRRQIERNSTHFALARGVLYVVEGKEIVGIDALSGAAPWRSAPFASIPAAPFSAGGFLYAGDRHAISAWLLP